MPDDKKNNELIEEIQLLIQYCVNEVEVEEAEELVVKYQSSLLILRLFKEYYSTLPEAREEPVVKISELIHRKGIYLFVLSSTNYSYLYVVSAEDVILLCEYLKDVSQEILSFFGYSSQKEFSKNCPPVEELKEYDPSNESIQSHCPTCGVEEGENHIFGCVVEVCPWCDGQLCNCNCRFEQLETEVIDSEEQLETFLDLLTDKGRVPFSRNQSPAYPGTSEGLDAM